MPCAKKGAQLDCGVHIAVVEPGAFHTGLNQKMIAKKYEWMRQGSYFANRIAEPKAQEQRQFAILELDSTRAIVRKIVQPWRLRSRVSATLLRGGRALAYA